MSTSLHAGRIGARLALESVTTIVWVSGTQEARLATVAARVDRDRDRSAGSNFHTCSVFPLASLTMPFVFPHHCLNFTNPCSQMALPGLGLIPPPYAFDVVGNIVPNPLMRRAALIGNLIGRIVRVLNWRPHRIPYSDVARVRNTGGPTACGLMSIPC